MIFLLNTSSLYVGGGVQVALSFISELKNINKDNEYHIFLSPVINNQLNLNEFGNNFKFYLIEKSPSSLKNRYQIVKKLNYLENKIKPDIVFSVFGPSYWRPKAKHLMGFADGWVYNPDSIVYKKLGFFKELKMRLLSKYKSYYLKRDADFFVLETNDAKNKLSKVLKINKNNIFVVGNTYSNVFNQKLENKNFLQLPKKENDEFRLLYIAHNHINKNLGIINEILPLLKDYNIKFILTIKNEEFRKLFSNCKHKNKIINLGPINLNLCPFVYYQSDALFAPTLLETFSASYPEAMKMEKAILTSNYSFATDICGDAALYFNPLDPKDIAEKILKLKNYKKLYNELIKKGKERLKSFETARSRAEKYLEICKQVRNR